MNVIVAWSYGVVMKWKNELAEFTPSHFVVIELSLIQLCSHINTMCENCCKVWHFCNDDHKEQLLPAGNAVLDFTWVSINPKRQRSLQAFRWTLLTFNWFTFCVFQPSSFNLPRGEKWQMKPSQQQLWYVTFSPGLKCFQNNPVVTIVCWKASLG